MTRLAVLAAMAVVFLVAYRIRQAHQARKRRRSYVHQPMKLYEMYPVHNREDMLP